MKQQLIDRTVYHLPVCGKMVTFHRPSREIVMGRDIDRVDNPPLIHGNDVFIPASVMNEVALWEGNLGRTRGLLGFETTHKDKEDEPPDQYIRRWAPKWSQLEFPVRLFNTIDGQVITVVQDEYSIPSQVDDGKVTESSVSLWRGSAFGSAYQYRINMLKSWQSTANILGHNAPDWIKGCVAVDAIQLDPETIYLFYTRKLDTREHNYGIYGDTPMEYGYPEHLCAKIPPAPSGDYYADNLCVAKYNPQTNGILKYRYDSFSSTKYDTALLGMSASYGRIYKVRGEDLYFYVAQAGGFQSVSNFDFLLFSSTNLLDWHFETKLDFGESWYPCIEDIGNSTYFYFCRRIDEWNAFRYRVMEVEIENGQT